MSLKKQRHNVVNPVPEVLPAGHTCGIREYIVSIGTARYQTFRGEWERWTDTPGRGCHQGYLRRITDQADANWHVAEGLTMKTQIAEAKILDNNGTYFINGSILPVYLNEDGDTYLIEEYEKGEPCEHIIKDLFADGVLVAVNPIGYN